MSARRNKLIRWTLALLAGAGVGLLAAGCKNLAEAGAAIGQLTGTISKDQADSIVKVGEGFDKALAEITPEQEYYLGRSVGAVLVNKFGEFNDAAATDYINVIGQTLAAFSDRPETFRGYRFLIMKSEDINAFAAPGGFIFVSRGLLRLCRTEDEIAAVLAHEVGHVQLKHAVGAISNSRWTQATTLLALEAGKNFTGEQAAELTKVFGESIGDVTKTLVTSGYARSQERAADKVAVTIMDRVGYNPNALVAVLQNMSKQLKPGGHDFAATHPPPAVRIADLQKIIVSQGLTRLPVVRTQRYAASMRGI